MAVLSHSIMLRIAKEDNSYVALFLNAVHCQGKRRLFSSCMSSATSSCAAYSPAYFTSIIIIIIIIIIIFISIIFIFIIFIIIFIIFIIFIIIIIIIRCF